MELVGKLTAKTLGWARPALQTATEHNTQPVKLGTIVGIVSGLKQNVNEETGDITSGLKGNFRGVSTKNVMKDTGNKDANGAPVFEDTGEPIRVTSGVCYLPGGIQEMLEGALAKAKEKDAKATISFGIDLYTVKDTNKAGYTFKAITRVETTESDPLDLLLEQATTAAAAALPAPDAVAPAAGETNENAQETADASGDNKDGGAASAEKASKAK